MPQLSKVIKSRDQLRLKYSILSQKNKNSQKVIKSGVLKNKRLEAKVKELTEKIEQEVLLKNKSETIPISTAQETRSLCVLLVLGAVVSFRSAPRILTILDKALSLNLLWIPHFTSVINWSLRLGLGKLKQVKGCLEPWVAIADHSIGFGVAKTLVVLRVKLSTLAIKGAAIALEDCECIGIKICEKVNGRTTAFDFEEIFKNSGHPWAIIKDCDSALNKGYHLYCDKVGRDAIVIDDLSHVIANALKAEYDNCDDFNLLKLLAADGSKKIRQTNLAFLKPPKLRKKGRFMNMESVAKWSLKMLKILAVKGKAAKGSQLEKLREVFPGFTLLKSFIIRFSKTTNVTTEIMRVLKNKGVYLETYQECLLLADQLPANSTLKAKVVAWLNKNYQIKKDLTPYPLVITSDIIETLFGQFKSIHERTPQSEMNRSVLLLPALCGHLNETIIQDAMNTVSQVDLNKWESENVPETIRKRRKQILDKNGSQKECHSNVA